MDQDNKIRWGLIIVVFFFLGLAVDYFFLHILFQEKMKEQQKQEHVLPTTEKPSSQHQQKAAAVGPTEVAQQDPQAQAATPAQFQEKATQCMGPELGKNPTPDDLVRELEKTNPVVKSQFQLENTHIRLPDGSERRMQMIIADNTNHKDARELRYFKLDAEGLPERIPLAPEQTYNPKPEFLQSLKSQGEVIYHQTKNSKTLKDGASMILTVVNNKVYEFQIFNHGKTFSCRELSCVCR